MEVTSKFQFYNHENITRFHDARKRITETDDRCAMRFSCVKPKMSGNLVSLYQRLKLHTDQLIDLHNG